MNFRSSYALPCLFLAVALVLFAHRLAHLDKAPFLNDEPRLQIAVERTFDQGTWPSLGPIGSLPIPYGPVPHWFYQTIRGISAAPAAPHWAHASVFLISQLLLGGVVWALMGASVGSLFLLLLASSPWLFVYSQMPWEVLLQVFGSSLAVAGLVLHLRAPGKLAPWAGGALWGLGFGMSVGTHLMAAALLPATLLALWPRTREKGWKQVLFFFGAGALSSGFLLLPYALALLESGALLKDAQGERWGNGRHFWWSLVKTPLYLSSWQMKYFLEPEAQGFFQYVGSLPAKLYYLDVFGWISKAVVWGAALLVLARWLRKKEVPKLLLFGAAGVTFHLLLLQYLNLATYPHYFLPFWWAPFLLLAAFQHRILIKVLCLLIVGGNILFLLQFTGYLDKNKGTRGDYYGSFFRNQQAVFSSLCQETGDRKIRLDLSAVRLQVHAAGYFFLRLPQCRGLDWEVHGEPLEGERLRLVYEEGTAHLRWERAE